jgi:DNA repair protein RecN (Recombination protein N)
MLSRLSVANIVLIDSIDLDLGPGLTIFTGETGAGKSIVLDALSLALGARGDGALVRSGAEFGQVTAVFTELGAALQKRLQDSGIDVEDEIIVRRQQFRDGRTRAYVNDQAVTAQILRTLARDLIEFHAQHDDRALLDQGEHRALVDAYAADPEKVAAVRLAYERLAALRKDLASEQAIVEARRADAAFAGFAQAEIETAAPRAGEERELAARRQAMLQGEKVAKDIHEANETLSGEGSVLATVAAVSRRLERRLTLAPSLIEPGVKALSEALNALELASQTLEAALRAADFNPSELERCEERLFALRALARKYGVEVDALPEAAQKFAAQVQALAAGESRIAQLSLALADAEAAYAQGAAELTKLRSAAASRLEAAVMQELPALKLEQGRFYAVVETDPTRVVPEGRDRVAFEVQTNPGSNRGDLQRIASGGELARFLLALKVALTEKTGAPTIVFDEIDTGVGGAVADAIGQRLARLADRSQVLAVTHAPQVAARATRHMKITKATIEEQSRAVTAVAPLTKSERQEEIARMLAGAEITKAARAAARSLLES